MLTLFTEPMLSRRYKAYKFAKNVAKFILRKPILAYSGHFAVSRSLDHGLRELNVKFNYNPKYISEVGDHVHVLGNVKALQLAIALKKKNMIKHLTAGPNVFQNAFEKGKLIIAAEIETYLCPSQWVIDYHAAQVAECSSKLKVWAAGVDTDYWSQSNNNGNSKRCILYIKNYNDKTFIAEVEKACISQGYDVMTVLYGGYNKEEYLRNLHKAAFMVMIGTTESQCLAQFEAWSANVPVICFPRDTYEHRGKVYPASSSPYMNSKLGVFFRDPEELIFILKEGKTAELNPRQWILDHGTDKASAINFLKQINYW